MIKTIASARVTTVSSAPASMSFPTPRDGFIAVSDYLAHTNDAASSWSEIHPGLGLIEQVQFLSTQRGFLLTREGLFSTTDGGSTWRRSGSTRPVLRWIWFTTPSTGWGLADGVLWRTVDSGTTWRRVVTPAPAATACFLSARTGWIVGSTNPKQSPVIFETVDGGATWSNRGIPAKLESRPAGFSPVYSVQTLSCTTPATIWVLIVPAGAGYAGGEAYGLYDSANGGQSWRIAGVNPGSDKLPYAPSHIPDTLVVASSAAAYIAASCGGCNTNGTTNVGVLRRGSTHWHTARLKGAGFSAAVLMDFPLASSGWAVTSHLRSAIYRLSLFQTRDYGRTWMLRPIFGSGEK
ncbi:MAG: WD40/YVTN/BNR-like repeat-containing protein [Acidimicrobiales bacterium]